MENNQFDALTQQLAAGSSPLAAVLRPRRGALAALVGGSFGLVSVSRSSAKKKPKKKKKCPAGQTCQPAGGTTTCPTGRTRLTNGTCASTCATPGEFVQGGCQCTTGTNTEGLRLLTPSVAVAQCNVLTQVCTATTECPVGQMCLNTGCGGPNANRCHAVCA